MKKLNLGIVAHVDAGKTSLTERLLYDTGVIDVVGHVDHGNTQMDTMEIERERGITINASVVSFPIDTDTHINLIDTPGHADFIAEVERALQVLDAAILVISAVDGVQAQTRILMQCLKKMKKPTLIFLNKVDQRGASSIELIKQINASLSIVAFPMVKVSQIGTRNADVDHYYTAHNADYRQHLIEVLADNNDPFLKQCIETNFAIERFNFINELKTQTANASLFPVYCGSAITGVGINKLLFGIKHLLPFKTPNPSADLAGTLFKIEHQKNGGKRYYINLDAGSLHIKDTLTLYRKKNNELQTTIKKISALRIFRNGLSVPTSTAEAGHIVIANGLEGAQIDDTLSSAQVSSKHIFSRPKLQTVICPDNPSDLARLVKALQQFSEEDPLISFRQNINNELIVNLYGDIQKEVISQRLNNEFHMSVNFSTSEVVCIERPIKTGSAVNIMDLHNPPLEFYATLGFRIEPGPIDSGIHYDMQAHSGTLPTGYHSVVKAGVFQFLEHGLYGWQVTDCTVTLTHTGICPLSMATHFRQLTPLLMKKALQEAHTAICEPYSRITLTIPHNQLNLVIQTIIKLQAKITQITEEKTNSIIIANVPTKHLNEIEIHLPGLTQGRGICIAEHFGFIPRQ